jgi:hypothetical protein
MNKIIVRYEGSDPTGSNFNSGKKIFSCLKNGEIDRDLIVFIASLPTNFSVWIDIDEK